MKWITPFEIFAVLALATSGASWAQSGAPAPSTPSQPQASAPAAWHAYRADFSLNELEGGKKTNSRQYSLDLNEGDRNRLTVGTKVPITVKSGEVAYQDVGTNINARVREKGDDLILEVQCNVSDLAEQPGGTNPDDPVLRQFAIDASTIVPLGKPTVLGVADDPNSKKQFQLEVLLTQLK
ncbi:MAG TPA: hypothetical protein VIY69_02000 [Candidatus Acidoferrales bacterium]